MLPDHCFERSRFLCAVSIRDQNSMGSPERADRLPQDARGEKLSVPKGIVGIDKNDITGPLEPKVLKSVIKNNRISIELLQCSERCVVPVPADNDGHSGKLGTDQDRLVTTPPGIMKDHAAVRDDKDLALIFSSVSPADHDRPLVIPKHMGR